MTMTVGTGFGLKYVEKQLIQLERVSQVENPEVRVEYELHSPNGEVIERGGPGLRLGVDRGSAAMMFEQGYKIRKYYVVPAQIWERLQQELDFFLTGSDESGQSADSVTGGVSYSEETTLMPVQ